jgi:hydrogenase nickel incorporation protein HypA/HybF
MHELPIIEKIISLTEVQARLNGAEKVLSITIETGAFSDLEPQWLNRYFRKMTEGTLLEDSNLIIKRQEGFYHCPDCGHNQTYQGQRITLCPLCGSDKIELKGESGYTLKEMEIQ